MNKHDPKFKALQDEWYKKLEESGFEDCEKDEYLLKIYSEHFKCHFSPVNFQARQEYYILAGQFLYSHQFKNERERKIWELHSQGMSIKQIAAALGMPRSRDVVHRTLKPLTDELKRKCKNQT